MGTTLRKLKFEGKGDVTSESVSKMRRILARKKHLPVKDIATLANYYGRST